MSLRLLSSFSPSHKIFLLPGILISGFSVYYVLSFFFVPLKITLPASIIIPLLVLGLTKYYGDRDTNYYTNAENGNKKTDGGDLEKPFNQKKKEISNTKCLAYLIFIVTYIVVLTTSGTLSGLSYNNNNNNNNGLFVPWQQFTAVDVMKLISAMALSFFFPGYALISIILHQTKHELAILPRVLLGYIFSIAIAAFTEYVAASMGFGLLSTKFILIVIYSVVFLSFLIQKRIFLREQLFYAWKAHRFNTKGIKDEFAENSSHILVFASLLALLALLGYVAYDGVIVGDQWFHHGRALQFISGSFKTMAVSESDYPYPPLLSSLLSSFFILADIPTVNAYASLGILNIITVFAFYYFFRRWVSTPRKRAALLASALFVLSSGFGWVHAINTFASDPNSASQISSLQTILTASKQTYDILTPSSFLLATHPEFSTSLQLIVLPIGFVLLGIMKEERINEKKYNYLIIIAVIVALAIFSHDEIYLFVIIACILPVIFRLHHKNFFYAGLLSANALALFVNYAFVQEEQYLGANEIMGMPLILLSFFLVVIAWVIYSGKILEKLYNYIIKGRIVSPKLFTSFNGRIKFAVAIVLVSIVCYFYVFTYITWAELSVKDIEIQTSEEAPRNVPWYLYPMKLGLTGILGICFILSYILRRFEKELFVFGIIGLIAIITGPYYDEHRFSKYVMVGLIGFASLLIYQIISFLNSRYHHMYPFVGAIIGAVVALSGISTLMFIGYQASSLETDNLEFLWPGRRNFPSSSELNMLEFLRNNTTNTNSLGLYNIVTWPDEYQVKQGLIGKLEGFTGLPIPKMLQSPLAFNASTLESFYNLLASSDVRFIVIPTKGIVDKADKLAHAEVNEGEEKLLVKLPEILKFALTNFQRVYDDDNFIILSVPSDLASPSPTGNTAVIHSWGDDVFSQAISDNTADEIKITLPYTDEFFKKMSNSEFAKIIEDKKSLLLYTYDKSQTLWSSNIEYKRGKLNYIEAKFRVTDENRSKQHNECGIVWENEDDKNYYVRIRDDKLVFSETPSSTDRFVTENQQIKLDKWIPYTLKMLMYEKTLNIYVDGSLMLRVPDDIYQNNNISRIGIKCSGNVAEFEPVKIAQVSLLDNNDKSLHKKQTYQYYYPLTSLALSGIKYDTFLVDDHSAFSKNNIVVTTGSIDDHSNNKLNKNANVDSFLEYVTNGGTLTIINTDKEVNGWFAESLFSVEYASSSKASKFDSIVETTEPGNHVELSGTITAIRSVTPDVIVRSYYENNDHKVSPFAMEKNYGKGKIILVNAIGHFDAVSRDPERYFYTLANIPRLIGFNVEETQKIIEPTITPTTNYYYLGNLTLSGSATINSSSLLQLSGREDSRNNNYYIKEVYVVPTIESDDQGISNDTIGNNSSRLNMSEDSKRTNAIFKDMLVNNLELYGQYKATIKSSGTLNLPSPSSPLSQYEYVSASFPAGFDMILTLENNASAKITTANGTEKIIQSSSYSNGQNDDSANNGAETQIVLHNITPEYRHVKHVDFLMKRPEVMANGNITFHSLFQGRYDFAATKDIEGFPLELRPGTLHMKLNYVDDYETSSKNKHTIQYLTYVESLNIDENMDQDINLRIPGDISDTAKQKASQVPWKEAISSKSSIVLIAILCVAVIPTIFLSWRKLNRRTTML